MYKIHIKDINEINKFAKNIASHSFPNMIICLDGEMGAGKTTFTKSFAKYIGVTQNVTSPTFTIIKEYKGNFELFHMDVYRLDGNVDGLGIEEYYYRNGICIIEWSSLIKDYLPDERLEIIINIINENERELLLIPHGEIYNNICKVL